VAAICPDEVAAAAFLPACAGWEEEAPLMLLLLLAAALVAMLRALAPRTGMKVPAVRAAADVAGTGLLLMPVPGADDVKEEDAEL